MKKFKENKGMLRERMLVEKSSVINDDLRYIGEKNGERKEKRREKIWYLLVYKDCIS